MKNSLGMQDISKNGSHLPFGFDAETVLIAS
jgi:hypothetical protein